MAEEEFRKAAFMVLKRLYVEGYPYLAEMGWHMCMPSDRTVSIISVERKRFMDITILEAAPDRISFLSDEYDSIGMDVFRSPFTVSMTDSLYQLVRSTMLEKLREM